MTDIENLRNFIQDINRWNHITGKTDITIPLNKNTAKEIADHLGSRLSPENLACDGELSYSQIKTKLKYLNNVELEFHKHCDSVGMPRQKILY